MGDVPVNISIYSFIDDEPRTELVGGLRIPSGKFGFRTADVAHQLADLPSWNSTPVDINGSSRFVICHWSFVIGYLSLLSQSKNDQ